VRDRYIRADIEGFKLNDIYNNDNDPITLHLSSTSELNRQPDFDTSRRIPGLSNNATSFFKTYKRLIEFKISDEEKDAGQTLVPYFDGSPVEIEMTSPLSGIAFVHYSNQRDYAGYIRPVLKTFNYLSLE